MTSPRAERERTGRRWSVVTGLSVTLLFAIVVAMQLDRLARRECTRVLYGAYQPSRRCISDEAWAWVGTGGSAFFWTCAALLFTAGLACVVVWLRSLRSE